MNYTVERFDCYLHITLNVNREVEIMNCDYKVHVNGLNYDFIGASRKSKI